MGTSFFGVASFRYCMMYDLYSFVVISLCFAAGHFSVTFCQCFSLWGNPLDALSKNCLVSA